MSKILLPLLLLAASTAYGDGLLSMDVSVLTEGGKLVYQGKTADNGSFETGNLEAGNYVVLFNSKGSAVKQNQFAFAVASGKTKIVAEAIPGDKLAGGGVAMRVAAKRWANITGQVTTGEVGAVAKRNVRMKIVKGKKYYWIASEMGSNRGGHWVEEGTPEASNIRGMDGDGFQKMKDGMGDVHQEGFPSTATGR